MFKDCRGVWVFEYIFGGLLVVVPMSGLYLRRTRWINAHIWAAALFVVCLGVILISCASSMRQRLSLAKRIDLLAKQIEGKLTSS